jgi:uncharacterized LabA/DUF88 family protein
MNQENLAAHNDQRVGVFIDTQNLYHSAKSNYRSNVNYEELISQAVRGRKLIRAFAYVIKSEEGTEEKFFESIQEMGIEIRVKDLQVFHTGAKKGDWDVGIAVDMIRLTEKLDVVVLCSGDGDFIEVIRYCKSRGVRAEVMAFDKTTNATLQQEADHFVDLGDSKADFLIGSKRKKTAYAPKPWQSGGYAANAGHESQVEPIEASATVAPRRFVTAKPNQVSPEYLDAKSNPVSQEYLGVKSAPVSKKYIPAQPNPVSGLGTPNNPYSGSNLSQVNRLSVNPARKVSPNIYRRNNNSRRVKPVVGLPAKSNFPKTLPRPLINDQTKNKPDRDNAFGNAKPVVKKKLF